jgi:hypothetical protein
MHSTPSLRFLMADFTDELWEQVMVSDKQAEWFSK